MRVEPPYNPLDKKNLGVSVADALLARNVESLPLSEPFIGAGIYAIGLFHFTHVTPCCSIGVCGTKAAQIFQGI